MVGEIIAAVSLLSAEEQEEQGVLYCDGTDRLRSSYPDLFAVIGVSFGSTGGTTFNLPDYRNAYLKGSDEVRSRGSHQHSNNKSHYHVYFYIRAVDYVKKTYDMLFALIDANCSKDESGVYDYTKLGKWVVGSGATERTLYLSEQLRQVLAYNYGGLV